VAGPFTVESLSPHRMLGVDEDGELIDPATKLERESVETQSFEQMILENLKTAGVQQADKEGKINFTAIKPWPGEMICAEGAYSQGQDSQDSQDENGNQENQQSNLVNPVNPVQKRAAIFIGPE